MYILDPENPPYDYPSPYDLRKKFIIKCGRPRIFRDPNKQPEHIHAKKRISFLRKHKNSDGGDNNQNSPRNNIIETEISKKENKNSKEQK